MNLRKARPTCRFPIRRILAPGSASPQRADGLVCYLQGTYVPLDGGCSMPTLPRTQPGEPGAA